VKIRTGTARGAQGPHEPAWLSPALELAANPQATFSEFVVSAGLGAFATLPLKTGPRPILDKSGGGVQWGLVSIINYRFELNR